MTTLDSATTRWRRRATCALASTAVIAAGTVALAGTAAAAGTTIYVDYRGQDGPNCGIQISQCATIQAGIDHASAGDTVLVAAGTYAEKLTISKAITVTSVDGADNTVIDGNGISLTNGLVDITQPGGDVTFHGFTVTNPSPSGNGQPFALSIGDAAAADHITVSNNVFPGDPGNADASANGPIGVDSANTFATQTITHNDFSGLFQGVLLEGSGGPVDVSGHNTFHDLVALDTGNGDGSTYPAEGIYFLGDKGISAADQNASDNDFSNYGGIGIAYRAGYNLGGCATTTCLGSISGSATGNTFELTGAAEGSAPAAAFRLQSLYSGDALNLTMSGNTGTVVAPTLPIIESAASESTISIDPGAGNAIVPTPKPTLTAGTPEAVTTGEPATNFSATATNPSGETIDKARYDVTIAGTKGIHASQVHLQYDTNPDPEETNFVDVPLTGTADGEGVITGHLGSAAGFSFTSPPVVDATDFRLSFPLGTPADTLSIALSLDQVSAGEGNPVINTLATASQQTVVTANTAPTGGTRKISTTASTPVAVHLGPATDVDGDTLTYTHTDPDATDGTVSGSGGDLVFTPADGFVGTTAFSYTVSDGINTPATQGTVIITVAKASSSVSFTIAPPTPTAADTVVFTVSVASNVHPVNGGTVTVTALGKKYTGTVSNGKATVTTAKLTAGTRSIFIDYSGTATVAASSDHSKTISVAKATSTTSVTVSPAKPTTKTVGAKLNITVASGVSPDGGTVSVVIGGTTHTATVSGGKASIATGRFTKGTHTWTVKYAGTSQVAASSKVITIVVTS